ncbi:glycosyltransferase family 4 protein [Candidatus Parcubacteria bacterium]|nr:glycosyltransferase family 4 protein [Patescibacteria group bacterium]MCG2694442.1 glycosyltransferase family 4 protein [Candidatus Parcubacteria bacterium]
MIHTKVAQIVCTFPPYKGGIGNSVYGFSRELVKQGAHVTVFTPNYSHISPEHNEDFIIKRINPVLDFGNAGFIPQIIFELKDFDIIHLHLPFLGATLPVWFYLVFHSKKKLILTYHMDLVGVGIKGLIFGLYQKIALPLILKRADKIIVSSFDYAENSGIKKYFNAKRKRFIELPFGVDMEKFSPREKNNELLKKYYIEGDDNVVLFVGGLDNAHDFKGLAILLKAIKEINNDNLRLIIVGEGELKQDYQNMAEGLGIAQRIVFAGGVADADLSDYYNLADVFVLPSISRSEAFGIVLLEAGACGTPLVASNLPGVRTVVQNKENGFLAEPGDVKDLAEKISKIIFDESLQKEMGRRARKIAEEDYKQERIIEKLMEIYK